MSPTTFIVITIIVIIAVSYYVLFVSRSTIIKDKINSVPRKKISEVNDGEIVTIKGHVVFAGRTLIAPLSKQKCVYYSVEISNWSMGGPSGAEISEQKGAELVITDGEDYAFINVKKVEALLHHDKVYGYDACTMNLLEFLTNSYELKEYVGKRSKNISLMEHLNTEVTATEGTLVEGELVALAGKASWRYSSQFNLNIPAKKLLYIEPLNEHGVYLTEDLF